MARNAAMEANKGNNPNSTAGRTQAVVQQIPPSLPKPNQQQKQKARKPKKVSLDNVPITIKCTGPQTEREEAETLQIRNLSFLVESNYI